MKSSDRLPGRTDLKRGAVFKRLRILFLLVVLLMVSLITWQDRYRSTRWREPLFVAVYPIAADDSPVTRAYMEALDAEGFKSIDNFFTREARRYHLHIDEPVKTRLRGELKERPPERRTDGGILAIGPGASAEMCANPKTSVCSCCSTTRRSHPSYRIRWA
jgi:hypothetical protein